MLSVSSSPCARSDMIYFNPDPCPRSSAGVAVRSHLYPSYSRIKRKNSFPSTWSRSWNVLILHVILSIHKPKDRERWSESGERSARRRHRTARVKASAHGYNRADTHVSNPHRYYSQRYELLCAHTHKSASPRAHLREPLDMTVTVRFLCFAFARKKHSGVSRYSSMRGQHTFVWRIC